MASDSYEQTTPIPLPREIYDAFVNAGFSPLTVIMFDEGGNQKTFVKPDTDIEALSIFEVEDLELPHLTVQEGTTKTSALRTCIVCNRWGCFRVPCVT